MSKSKWAIAVAVVVVLACYAGPSAVAETVVEAWRSPSGEFSGPHFVSVNPTDGSCWVADPSYSRVVHLSPAGAELWLSGSGEFSAPYFVSANPTDGSCWVEDGGHSQMVRLSAAGAELWRSPSGEFNWPWVISVNPTDGSCWVTDCGDKRVVHLSAAGTELWRSASGEFTYPQGVSANPTDGSCWVTDYPYGDNQVVHLSAAGAELWRSAGGEFNYPVFVSANPADGSCWVADYDHSQVVHLSPAGAELWRSADGDFNGPDAVSADLTDGSCWVTDENANQVVHLSAAGAELWRSPSGEFNYPVGISVDPRDGSCWVADQDHGQVVKLVVAPSADFSATPTSGLAPLPVSFTYLAPATPTWAAATAWQWDFGDGGTSDAQDPSYTYAKPGYCTVSLIASNAGGLTAARKPHYILVSFPDVPVQPPFWAIEQILACVDAGIVAGYPDGTYGPANTVTRDQMAVYISRALTGSDDKVPTGPATATFSDVPTDYWAFRYVEYAATQNVVQGYSDGTYKPTDQVDRGQMAVFIARSIYTPTAARLDLTGYTPPATPTFPDVATTFWAYKYVEYIAQPAIGVTKGYPDGDYHPEYVCTRDQMAVYVARAFKLPILYAFAGTYSASYAAGFMTIVVDVTGDATIVIVDSTAGVLTGTGTVSDFGTLAATAQGYGTAISVAVSGQFASQGGTFTVSGSLAGLIGADWTGQKIADPGVNAFAGDWSGSYSGSEFGTWQAVIQTDGSVIATAQSPSVGTVTLTGTVAPSGSATLQGSGSGVGGAFTITWKGTFYVQGIDTVGVGTWISSSGFSGNWSGQRQGGAVNPFAGTYSASYGTGSSGSMTIALDQAGSATIVIIDPSAGLLTGTGTVSDSGTLAATAQGYGTAISVAVSGQFASQGGTFTVSGSLAGSISADWTGQKIADPGVNAFAGNWSGSYSGSTSGTWQATVQTNGNANGTTESPTAGTMSTAGTVAPAGFIIAYGYSGPYTITWGGAFYMRGGSGLCSGLWTSTSGGGGSWNGQRQ
jgi:PKD repeat protein